MENGNEFIHPITKEHPTYNDFGDLIGSYEKTTGLTKREYFAGLAMQAIITNNHHGKTPHYAHQVAEESCIYADKLLHQLSLYEGKKGEKG